MKYKKYDCEAYSIHTIKTDKFKNCTMEVIFRKDIEKEEITKTNFLLDMLTMSSKDYPTRRDVVLELENLYNASFRANSSRVGNAHIINFITNFIDPKYCDKGYLEDVLSFGFKMLLNPNVSNDEFDLRTFNIEKSRLNAEIVSLKESGPRYAMRRCMECADDSSPSSYNMSGYLEDLEKITPSNLYDTYKNLLKKYKCDIYIIGNLDMDRVVEIIKMNFCLDTVKDYDFDMYINEGYKKKVSVVKETGDYKQSTLLMAYNTGKLTEAERNITMYLYNMILGEGSLEAKLPKVLREENSLCYKVSSLYNKYDRLLVIYAGIDKKNYDLSVKLVKKCLKEMVAGDFSEEQLENNKKQLISAIKVGQDIPGSIINTYLFHNLDNVPLYDERIEMIKNVTKKDIIEIAKKIKGNIIYFLSDGEGE